MNRRVLVSIASLATLVGAIVTSHSVQNDGLVEKNTDLGNLSGQVILIQDCLDGNTSQVEELTAQVENLNKEIIALKLTIVGKTEENEKLKRQALALSDFVTEIEAQLSLLEKAEQIYLVADRLRHPVNVSEDGSLCEG